MKKIQKKRERAKVCYLGIRSMYDDISFSKDDFDIRSIHGREYAICMTTLRIVKTIFVHAVFFNKNESRIC